MFCKVTAFNLSNTHIHRDGARKDDSASAFVLLLLRNVIVFVYFSNGEFCLVLNLINNLVVLLPKLNSLNFVVIMSLGQSCQFTIV